jgi:hypothetical protein
MIKESSCLHCKKVFIFNDTQKRGRWCGNKCQMDHQYEEYIQRWKEGKESGVISSGLEVSNHIRRYFHEKHSYSCSECGWNRINQVTGKSPLHLNHIDGNSMNNKEENLQILCPNCHSLTPNFGILNKGNGRYSRTGKQHPKHTVIGK